jgi:hypothetical protein
MSPLAPLALVWNSKPAGHIYSKTSLVLHSCQVFGWARLQCGVLGCAEEKQRWPRHPLFLPVGGNLMYQASILQAITLVV